MPAPDEQEFKDRVRELLRARFLLSGPPPFLAEGRSEEQLIEQIAAEQWRHWDRLHQPRELLEATELLPDAISFAAWAELRRAVLAGVLTLGEALVAVEQLQMGTLTLEEMRELLAEIGD